MIANFFIFYLLLIIFCTTYSTILYVDAQEYPFQKNNTNISLTEILEGQIYKEICRITSNSIVLNVDSAIKSQDSYTAIGMLKGVGNVIDKSIFVTTYHKGSNVTSSTGKGFFTTLDGQIATYIGQDVGTTDKN